MEKKARRDKGQPRWTDRDLWLLHLIAEMYIVRVDQLQELMSQWTMGKTLEEEWLSEGTVRHWIERWRRAGILKHGVILSGKPGVVWLTRKGLRTLGLPYQYWEPVPDWLRHLFYIVEVRIKAEDDERQPSWTSERWLSNQHGLRKRGDRLPDGVMFWEDGDGKEHIAAIEVELSRKNERRLQGILIQVGQQYQHVFYYAPPDMVPWLKEEIGKLRDDWLGRTIHDRFRVEEIDEDSW